MTGFRGGQFTRIKGVSEKRRLPRLGKIRLGVKLISKKTGKEFPKEVDYFVCPDEVVKVYGAEPKELDVMFPVNDPEVVFPQAYVWYGSSRGAKCRGDGERAIRVNEETGEFLDRECPCELLEQKKCQRRAHLLALLPKVSLGGIYQIDLGSYHSIVDINSGMDYVEALVGRFAMIPLLLRRTPRETHGSGTKETHYTLQLLLNADVNSLNSLRENTNRILMGPQYALPAPEDLNPALDPGAVVEVVDEEGILIERWGHNMLYQHRRTNPALDPGAVVEVVDEEGTLIEPGTPADQPEYDSYIEGTILPYLQKNNLDPIKIGQVLNLAGTPGLDPKTWTKDTAPQIKAVVQNLNKLIKQTKKTGPELLDQLIADVFEKIRQMDNEEQAKGDPGLTNQLSGKKVDRKASCACPKDGEFRTGGWCQDMCMEFVDCKMWK